jgi:hypothetical protein
MSEAIKSSAEEGQAVNAYGWAARDSSGILSPFHFTRRYVFTYDLDPLLLHFIARLLQFSHCCLVFNFTQLI